MEYTNNINRVYDYMLIDFMQGMKMGAAQKVIKDVITNLILSGYSKEELKSYLNALVGDDGEMEAIQ